MKIKTKIALRYSIVTAILMTVFALVIYFMSAHDREVEFYNGLYKEGVSKANLFFEAKTTPDVLHSIYKNNIEYIDEVEVAIYTTDFELLYHDAKDIDLLKETPELIHQVADGDTGLKFYIDEYQVTAFPFYHHSTQYIITAVAYDGYGYVKQKRLIVNLFSITIISILISFLLGYILAKRALKPVARISNKMKNITGYNLDLRLLGYNQVDEFGELAASFNKALDIIESSFESQKMFVSNVSHELRTPLSALVGEIDYALLKERSVEEYIETLQNSKHDTVRLIKLLNGLLDLAKASYDESKISMSPIRVDEILLDAREYVLKANPNYKVDLQFNLLTEDDADLTIDGNEYLLKIAFVNLIENNCKFSNNKTSTVNIYSNDKSIQIKFSDTGIGIPADDLEQIFTPFYRGANKDFTDGNGIGIPLVNRVIKIHKGTIDIVSAVNIGTTFSVEI